MSTNITKMRVKGVVYNLNRLYDTIGSNVDGSMTQASITSELNDVQDAIDELYDKVNSLLDLRISIDSTNSIMRIGGRSYKMIYSPQEMDDEWMTYIHQTNGTYDVSEIMNDEFAAIYTDEEGKIIFGVYADGTSAALDNTSSVSERTADAITYMETNNRPQTIYLD